MHILFACPQHDAEHWLPPLQTTLPDARFSVWDPDAPASGASIALVWQPPDELFSHEKSLTTIFNLGAGVDALLKLPSLPKDLRIVRLEDAGMSAQIAEYAVHAITQITRNFKPYAELQKQGDWNVLDELPRSRWPVGVLGMGVVGARVATTLAALDYPVAGWSRSPKEVPGIDGFHGMDQLPEFLARTRILINVLPLTAQTQNLLGRRTLGLLIPDCVVINVGRGASLVEYDLLALLETGHVRAAALDVFQTEPLPAQHPFWTHPRVSITPHIAARTLREETIAQIAGKLQRLGRGESISGVIERDRGY